jgi:hypothetical protein
MTEQQLATAIYDSLAAFQMTAQLSSLQHAQMRQYLAEHLAGTLTPLLADARVQAIRDLADKADPQRPEISFFGDHGHIVGEWMRKQAEYEQQRLAATPAADTLPAWLYSRFNESLDAPAWDRLTDDDRTYWEHQARAVRRAVARGGFKTAAEETHVVADDSDDPEHVDDCPGCAAPQPAV